MTKHVEELFLNELSSHLVATKVQQSIHYELAKGCEPTIYPMSVSLEPNYQTLGREQSTEQNIPVVLETEINSKDLCRLQVLLSSKQSYDWYRPEKLLRRLTSVNNRIGFEIVGNSKSILILILCHTNDAYFISNVFPLEYDYCQASILKEPTWQILIPNAVHTIHFRDYYPLPPYHHLLTRYDQLHVSPLGSLITAMKEVKPPSVALYQTLFQPVHPDHNWHANIQKLTNLEYGKNLMDDPVSNRYSQQIPSSALNTMAHEVAIKAHDDKPFFAVAYRFALFNDPKNGLNQLRVIASKSNLFQHGGQRIRMLDEQDYRHLTTTQKSQMFFLGNVYRPGFILNSLELTGFVHLPSPEPLEEMACPIELLNPHPKMEPGLDEGIRIGTSQCGHIEEDVCLSLNQMTHHVHIPGASGKGKSTLLESMIVSALEQECGIAVIDPHRDLIERLLLQFKKKDKERIIYFNPSDPDWIPLWNPIATIPGQDMGRTTEDFIGSFKGFFREGWGDRLEHLLRFSIYSLLHLPEASLIDVITILQKDTPEFNDLRQRVLHVVRNEFVRKFWLHDYKTYPQQDYRSPKHKLCKILLEESCSRMFLQKTNRFNFREIMDRKMIFLSDISGLGVGLKQLIGSLQLALFHQAALTRADIEKDKRSPFLIFCDEAHYFDIGQFEEFLAQTLKYQVGLILAHHYLKQFDEVKIEALSTITNAVIFKSNVQDAQKYCKRMDGRVEVKDIVNLKTGEAIANIDNQIIKINTPPPKTLPQYHHRDEIIRHSYENYYKKSTEYSVPQKKDKSNGNIQNLSAGVVQNTNGNNPFYYEELE